MVVADTVCSMHIYTDKKLMHLGLFSRFKEFFLA